MLFRSRPDQTSPTVLDFKSEVRMSYKIKPATAVKIQGYSFRSKNRDAHLDRIGAFSISTKIKQIDSIDEKFDLVDEANPFLHIFGRTLKPTNHYTKEYRDGEN